MTEEAAWMDWVGREVVTTALLEPVTANRMAVTLDREPNFSEGDHLPPAWHWLYFHDTVRASSLGCDGHPVLGVTMPPVPLPRRMWAAGEFTFDTPLLLGERATRTSTVRSIERKSGRTGALFFVTVEHDVRGETGSGFLESQTIVYREMEAQSGPPPHQDAKQQADLTVEWQLTNTALFRYSALTFNAHRIHYDVDYCREVEGYPNLVIHGPLLATLLMDLAESRGQLLAAFRYRARSPLFIPETFTTNAMHQVVGLRLWAAGPGGRVAMDAEAEYTKETDRA